MGFMQGKRALIMGVASNRSIAWGVAKAMHNQGAELAFTYQGERLGERVTKFAQEVDSDIVVPCDVSSDEDISNAAAAVAERWDGLDVIVHAIAFAPREAILRRTRADLTRTQSAICLGRFTVRNGF